MNDVRSKSMFMNLVDIMHLSALVLANYVDKYKL
jgi:hypothetical protein